MLVASSQSLVYQCGPEVNKPLPPSPQLNYNNTSKHDKLSIPQHPLSLRPVTLLSFATLFAILQILLVLLWDFSRRTGGFVLLFNDHFGWSYRYGPTSLLIIITSLWRQVDHHCKISQPWRNLSKGEATADSSILLDYLSPLQPVVVWRALANGHPIVALAGLGFLLLKLIAVVSTGLLFPTNVAYTLTNQPMVLLDVFEYAGAPLSADDKNAQSPVYQAWAYLARNLSLPQGMNSEAVYQTLSIDATHLTSNITYSAEVEALYPTFQCAKHTFVPAVMIPTGNTSDGGYFTQGAQLTDPDFCKIHYESDICDPRNTRCPSSEVQLWYGSTDCGYTGRQWVFVDYQEILYDQSNTEDEGFNGSHFAESWSTSFGRSSSLLCEINYQARFVRSVYNTSTQPATVLLEKGASTREPPNPNFSIANLTSAIDASLDANRNMFSYRWPLQGMVEDIANATHEDLFDLDAFLPIIEDIYMQLALHNIAQKMIEKHNTTITGNITMIHGRLVFNNSSFGFLAGGLGAMLIISLCLSILCSPYFLDAGRNGTIWSIAQLLRQHKMLNQHFDRLHFLEKAELKPILQSFSYNIADDYFGIQPRISTPDQCIRTTNPTSDKGDSSNQFKWWQPLALRKGMLFLAVAVPIITIIALEYTQQLSRRNNGIAMLNNKVVPIAETIYLNYLPATFMVLIAAMYSSLDFWAAVLAPWNTLRGPGQTRASILSDTVLGQLPPVALYNTVRRRQWCATAASLAAFIGSMLTIVVSGLFTVDSTPTTISLSLLPLDEFAPEWLNSTYDDGGAGLILSLIEKSNLSYPAFTYDQLALPALEIDLINSHPVNQVSGLASLNVTALRANLRCEAMKFPQMVQNLTYYESLGELSYITTVTIDLPEQCVAASPKNQSTATFTWQDSLHESDPPLEGLSNNYRVAMYFQDLHPGQWTKSQGEGRFQYDVPDNAPGCPSIGIAWFTWDILNKTSRSSVLICYQELQEVDTLLSLTYPNLSIPESHPPSTDESSVKSVRNSPEGATTFEWRIESAVSAFFVLNETQSDRLAKRLKDGNPNPKNYFFQGAMLGRTPFAAELLFNDYDPKVLDSLQAFYRRYMAQVINLKMRRPVNQTQASGAIAQQSNSPLRADLVPYNGMRRIVQHKVPKLILQSMLGLVALLGIIALSSGRFQGLVPFNPCSIAGVSVLLAGSKLCRSMDDWSSLLIDKSSQSKRDKDEKGVYGMKVHISEYVVSRDDVTSLGKHQANQALMQDTHPGISVATCSPLAMTSRSSLWTSFGLQARAARSERDQRLKWKDTALSEWQSARFRLGWWKDGVYQGASAKHLDIDFTNPSWRYGIDYI